MGILLCANTPANWALWLQNQHGWQLRGCDVAAEPQSANKAAHTGAEPCPGWASSWCTVCGNHGSCMLPATFLGAACDFQQTLSMVQDSGSP